jgi:hypothetical protein
MGGIFNYNNKDIFGCIPTSTKVALPNLIMPSSGTRNFNARGCWIFFKDIRLNFFSRPLKAEPTDHGGKNIPNMEISYPI